MRKIALLIFCFVVFTLSSSAKGWPREQVTRSLSLSFPAEPQRTMATAGVSYLYLTDTTAYLAQVTPHPEDGKVHDSITLVSFYSGMYRGILRASKGTLLKADTTLRIADLKAMQVEYVKGDKDQQPVTVCSRAILVNDDILVYSFTAPSARYEAMARIRDQFFATLTVGRDSALIQYRPNDHADTLASLVDTARTVSDTTAHQSAAVHIPFFESHAGSVVKMFGMLIIVCALIYGFAVYTRRKG